MHLVELDSATAWLERAAPLLLADEPRNNLILGLAGTVRDHPDYYPDAGLWLVVDRDRVVGAALRTRPLNLVLGPATAGAAEVLARSLREEAPGVVGCTPEIEAFVTAFPGPAEARVRQGIYALRRVISPRATSGSAREATHADRDLVLEWWHAFSVEALGEREPDRERLRRNVEHRLTRPEGGTALWEDGGEVVSVVGYGSPTPSGMRIGPVYTPPEHRGRGYASALTAHVSKRHLDAGYRFCFLYTDLANPTSNKIYAALGYEQVGESVEYAFR